MSTSAQALNFEHAWGDGVAVLRLVNEVHPEPYTLNPEPYTLKTNP